LGKAKRYHLARQLAETPHDSEDFHRIFTDAFNAFNLDGTCF
jgi:hypothetical protein